MCPRFVAARPPAAAQPPSGDTSGEGDTTGAGGQGNQTADPPAPENSQAASHAGSSPGASDADDAADNAGDAGESGDECEKDEPTDRPEGVARNSPPGTPDGAVILPKVRTVISPGSAWMHALGAMAGRILTEQEAKRLETQKTLPPPELDSRGNVQAPSRHDFSVDPSSLGRTFLVGVPALQDHQRQAFHTRDGYGGLESLIQVEELGHADMFDLQEFSSADNPVVSDLLLSSRASTAPGDELESIRHSIPAQREMATLLSEYGVDRLPERTISTVSVLRRVLDRYRRVCHQLDASPSQSRQNALKAQDQLHAAKLSYEFDRAHWESERQQSADAATYTAERYQDDVKELVHEHNANKRGLQEEISKLRQELEDAHAYQRVLDRHVRESRFNVTDLMNFWATTPHWPAIGCASVIFYNIIKTALPFPRVGKPSLLRLRVMTRCHSLERSLIWIIRMTKMVKASRRTIQIRHPTLLPKDVHPVAGHPAPPRLPLTPNGLPNEAPTRRQRPHSFVPWSESKIRPVAFLRVLPPCGRWKELAGHYRGPLCGMTSVWTFSG
ncbi:hypothetical protein PF006_g18290 [Phytophthora fragariae]|uniref:Uncharacterized protein n=1 Tax=Phytophthora fragariae TaxID=53985 RepID=A0A6A3SMH9_9STRA|nr:hypothetical protein PF006_g18290 [Phytophthora fragariae]